MFITGFFPLSAGRWEISFRIVADRAGCYISINYFFILIIFTFRKPCELDMDVDHCISKADIHVADILDIMDLVDMHRVHNIVPMGVESLIVAEISLKVLV